MPNFDFSYLSLPKSFYSISKPSKFVNAEIVLFNEQVAKQLGLSNSRQDLISLITNEKYHQRSYAQAYAGHQFGHFTKLGDGRALILGEHCTANKQRFDIQLKGSGKTIYSRRGDGKATLKAMLREYLVSESMYYLDIPSSRSLSVINTKQDVYRETIKQGGLLTRVMKSHIRVGTFEYARYFGSKKDLQALTNYTIDRLYPELNKQKNPSISLLKKVMNKQIDLVIHWMRVGFIHGVMNTDNTAISGETFDYGPCAFLNSYHPKTAYSSIDRNGRYAFGNQERIIKWNITRFAEALLPIIHHNSAKALQLAQSTIDEFDDIWKTKYQAMMLKKIGIDGKKTHLYPLVAELLECMEKYSLDYTHTFLMLSKNDVFVSMEGTNTDFVQWKRKWKRTIETTSSMKEANIIMSTQNPVIIPRNQLIEKSLEEATNGNLIFFNRFLNALSRPYTYDDSLLEFMTPPSQNFEKQYQTFCGT